MRVRELREALEGYDDNDNVAIAVQDIPGWVCPDGMIVGIDKVVHGIDWHMTDVILIPSRKLRLTDDEIRKIEEESNKRRREWQSRRTSKGK